MKCISSSLDVDKANIDFIVATTDQFAEVIDRPVKKVPSLREVLIYFIGENINPILSISATRLSADIIQENISFFNSAKSTLDYFKKIKSINPAIVVSNYSTSFPQELLVNNLEDKFTLISCDENPFN